MPSGRLLSLDDPARRRDDGTIVTIGEAIITAVSLGQEHTAAAKGAGVSAPTLHTWRVTGARARTQQLKGRPVTPNDERLIGFLDGLERAESNAELERLAIIHRAAQPFVFVREVVTVNADGQVTERKTTTEQRQGLWGPAAWWLERRIPHRYARRVEITGPDGGDIPIGDRARTLADSLSDYLQGAADAEAATSPAATPAES